MFSSTQTTTVGPLHNRNGALTAGGPVSANGSVAAVPGLDKESVIGDGRHSTSPLPTAGPAIETTHEIMAVTSSAGALAGTVGSGGSASASQITVTPMMRVRDRICFQHLLMAAGATAAALVFAVWCVWRATADKSIDPVTGKVVPYTFQYFVYCFLGGIVAGTVHVVVTPIDVVKCRVQVGEYRSFKEGFLHLYRDEGGSSVLRALPLFFRGWVPTAWGYCIQGAIKFSLYEAFKYGFLVAPLAARHAEAAAQNPAGAEGVAAGSLQTTSVYDSKVFQLLMFLLASSLAEAIADVGLAPWEAVKIRMQTSHVFSTSLRTALPRMWEAEGMQGFYKGLVPLWCRQVPYTMMKFASFEFIVVSLTAMFQAMELLDVEQPSAVGKLFISLLAGVLAGVLCGLVSHPADTVLSKLNQKSNVSAGGGGSGGGAPLLASTIAAARSSSGMGGSSGALHDTLQLVSELGWRGLWKGLAPRLLMVSTLTALQWVTYDGFKVFVGLPTSGGVKH